MADLREFRRPVAQKFVTDGAPETMARTANLLRRNGRYYFNKAFPKALWPVLGKAPFRVSLDTTDVEQAQRRRIEAEKAYWAKVDAARGQLAESQPRALTEADMDLARYSKF